MSASSILPFRAIEPPTGASAAAAPVTLGAVITTYRAHLDLKLQLGQVTQRHFDNVSATLQRFAETWRVCWPDGRQAMVRPEVAVAGDAIAQAAAQLRAARQPEAQPPEAVRNRDWPLGLASSDDLTRWLIANPQWKAGWTKHNNLVAVIACFAWYEEETGTRVPYRRSRMPRFEKNARREADAREYVALMRHTSSIALRRILWCLWNVNGIRTCEARELGWTDFRWDAGCIVLERHKTRRRTGKPKIIGLTPRQLRFFVALKRQAPPGQAHVFVNNRGEPWTRRALAGYLRETARRIGLDENVAERVSAYCFRHAFATQCDEAGVDQAKTALLMGHEGPEMIQRVYSKVARKFEPARKAAIDAEAARRQARRAARPPRMGKPRADQPELFD